MAALGVVKTLGEAADAAAAAKTPGEAADEAAAAVAAAARCRLYMVWRGTLDVEAAEAAPSARLL